jgi:hypothetical protein
MVGDEALLEALGALARALGRVGQPFMLIGGLAVIARGVTRHTDDVDATIWAPDLDLEHLLASLRQEGIVGRIPDVADFARTSQVLLLRHEPSGTPLEISLAWLPFEQQAMARAEAMSLGSTRIPVALPEDLIIYKAVAWRDRDRSDVERLFVLHRDTINLVHVREIVQQFAEALEEPERVAELDALVAAAFGGDPP